LSFEILTSFISERPLPSLMGTIAPRLTWLLINRLHLSEFARRQAIPKTNKAKKINIDKNDVRNSIKKGNRPDIKFVSRKIFKENEAVDDKTKLLRIDKKEIDSLSESNKFKYWVQLPFKEGISEISRYMHERYFTKNDPHIIKDILSRGGEDFKALNNDCNKMGIPLVLFLIPEAGMVDSAYIDFWRPWPGYLSRSFWFKEMYKDLIIELEKTDINFVDLIAVLEKEKYVYRKTDGHWNEKGHQIVSGRVIAEIEKLRSF